MQATFDGLTKSGVSLVHVIGIKHLISFITTLLEFIFQISIAKIVQIQDTVNSYRMITLRSFVKFNFFPLFMGRWISPSRTVNEKIFWKSLNSDNSFFVLNIEGIEVTPEVLFFKSFFNSANNVAKLVDYY